MAYVFSKTSVPKIRNSKTVTPELHFSLTNDLNSVTINKYVPLSYWLWQYDMIWETVYQNVFCLCLDGYGHGVVHYLVELFC